MLYFIIQFYHRILVLKKHLNLDVLIFLCIIYTDRNTAALSNAAYANEVKAKIPMGYWGTPEDCVEIIKTLCSDGAKYITGQNIFVDGGMGIK